MTTVADFRSGWKTAAFRFTVFSHTEYKLGEVQQWWKAITGTPERDASSQNLGRILQVAGATPAFQGHISVQNGQRADFVFGEPLGSPAGVVNGLGPWTSVQELANKVVGVATSHLGKATRIAYAPELVCQADTIEAVKIIRAYMANIRETWDSAEELALRVNLPVIDASIPGGRINRVVAMEMAKMFWGLPLPQNGQPTGIIEVDLESHPNQKPIVKMVLDINNKQSPQAMSIDELKAVADKCASYANAIINNGVQP